MARRVGFRLDVDTVVSAAIELLDRDGAAALSMSNVAEVLGVRPSALYTYIDGAGHLHHVAAVRATINLTQSVRDAALGVAGEDALRAVAAAYREFARLHPGQYSASVAPPVAVGEELARASADLHDLLALILRSTGLDEVTAAEAATTMRSTLHGFVALEAVEAHHVDPSHFDQMITVILRGFIR